VWLRFDYQDLNPSMQDVPIAWRRMEAREAVDCRGRRARDLAMTVFDTAGVSHDGSETLSRSWRSFEDHPLTVDLFEPLCATLVRLETQRGA
jgi:hypothetical protein